MTVCAGLDPLHPEGCLLRASWPHRGARAEVSKQTPRHRDSQTMQEENTDCLQQIFFYVPEMAEFLCSIYFRKATNDLTFSGKSDLHNCFRVYRNAELHIRFHILFQLKIQPSSHQFALLTQGDIPGNVSAFADSNGPFPDLMTEKIYDTIESMTLILILL